MNTTSYLVGFIDTTQSPPVVVGAGVYSEESPTSELFKRRPFLITLALGSSFEDALQNLSSDLRTGPGKKLYSWAVALLSDNHKHALGIAP